MLAHAALVGVAAGAVGAAFFAGAELMQAALLESLAGYHPLRAVGETFAEGVNSDGTPFRPWVLLFLPALGAGL
ncbi:MAG TPA: chloride channel protein, partial [Myxococcota bacterium]|nr:chloride channel protein [Myxococcota bacterium]